LPLTLKPETGSRPDNILISFASLLRISLRMIYTKRLSTPHN